MAEGPTIAGGRLVRKNTQSPLLDVLIVGAGPTGSSAAFALKEAGHTVLVVDKDDILARARDGAGPFPTGQALPAAREHVGRVVPLLREMAQSGPDRASWRVTYATYDIPHRTDLELTGLKRLTDGTYKALFYNHDRDEEETLSARRILLTTGSGRPLPETMEQQLTALPRSRPDAAAFSGLPLCVLGASRAAVETVLALAEEKIDAGDPAPILWCGAGTRLPRIPRQLHRAFHRAYVVHDKIRFYPDSQPLALITGLGEPHVGICTERKSLGGMLHAAHLELPSARCVFAAGRESPVALLTELGIEHGEVNGMPLVRVQSDYGCSLPGVYLAGSMLSPSYQCRGTSGDRLVFREDSLWEAISDGLKVAAAMFAETPREPEAPKRTTVTMPALTGYHLARLRPDGSHAEYYPISSRGVTIGKKDTQIVFPEDPRMEDLHATIIRRTGKHVLRDEDSRTGVFYKLPATHNTAVNRGDLIRLGGQFLVFDTDDQGAWARHYDREGNEGGLWPITEEGLILGREGTGCLDADDPDLSDRHLVLRSIAGTIHARDLGSAAGSYLRVMRDYRLAHGDIFMLGGEHLMFIDRRKEQEAAEAPEGVPDVVEGTPSVAFENHPGRFPLARGGTLLEAAQAAGIPLKTQCLAGACGSDLVEILSGQAHVDAHIGPVEAETLRHVCGVVPGTYRLACRLRVYGPVTVRLAPTAPRATGSPALPV